MRNNVIKNLIYSALLLFSFFSTNAQELNCKVDVNYTQIQGIDVSVFQKLKKDIYDFMNSRKWTPDNYSMEERIECNLFINLTSSPSTDNYSATIQVQSFRPVYGTTYKSMILDINDRDFGFTYTPSQTMDYSDNQYLSNLTSVLAFYAYVILGYDYDSYSLKGGTDYFQKAQAIINTVPHSAEKTWKVDGSKYNRYWLLENLLTVIYEPLRTSVYNYHRLGLDVMSTDVNKGRSVIEESLKSLEPIYKRKPNAYSMIVFFDSKNLEIINIFKDESYGEKQQMIDYLSKINPPHAARYAKISQR